MVSPRSVLLRGGLGATVDPLHADPDKGSYEVFDPHSDACPCDTHPCPYHQPDADAVAHVGAHARRATLDLARNLQLRPTRSELLSAAADGLCAGSGWDFGLDPSEGVTR